MSRARQDIFQVGRDMTQREAADIVKTAGDVHDQIVKHGRGVASETNTACFFIGNSAAYLFHAMPPKTKRDLNMHLIAASGLDEVGAMYHYENEFAKRNENENYEPEWVTQYESSEEYFDADSKIPAMRWCHRTFKNNRMRDAVVYLVDFVSSGRSMVNLVRHLKTTCASYFDSCVFVPVCVSASHSDMGYVKAKLEETTVITVSAKPSVWAAVEFIHRLIHSNAFLEPYHQRINYDLYKGSRGKQREQVKKTLTRAQAHPSRWDTSRRTTP